VAPPAPCWSRRGRPGSGGTGRHDAPMRSARPSRAAFGWSERDGPAELSTGCTECCGNVDYSTFANCGIFVSRHPCGMSREAIHSPLRRARRGSRTKQHREAVRGGPQGPKRKVSRGCGRNRDRLGEFFFGPPHAAARGFRLNYDRRDAASAPAASAEHRPGRDRRDLGDRPGHLHLLRAPGGGRERCDGNRDRARLVRWDLASRAPAR
jgi:hypothetical protein